MNAAEHRYRVTRRVTLVGAVVDILLGIGKILTGVFANSQALIADGIHSLSDLGTDMIVILAARHASREADEDHPYGHGRIETAMTVGLGIVLILVAAGIGYQAVHDLLNRQYSHPTIAALYVAGFSIVAKEIIYHYTIYYARRIRSKMMEANAWHSRTDAISSLIVVIGIVGVMMGLEYLDSIAAIVVAAIIFKIGYTLSMKSVRELVDTGLDQDTVGRIRETILSVDGVEDLHYLRTRTMGSEALVDVHIQVGEELSVSEGHQISENVRYRLIQTIEEIGDVMVHIDPENDAEDMTGCCTLPSRKKLLAELGQEWQTIVESTEIKKITLHYLRGGIRIELLLSAGERTGSDEARELDRKIRKVVLKHPDICDARVAFEYA